MSRGRTSKSSIFLIFIMIVLIIASALVLFSLRTDFIKDHLAANRLLNVLFVLEQDGKPLSTNVLLYYPEQRRSALFNIPNNTGLLIKSIDRVDRIDAVYEAKGAQAFASEVEGFLGISLPFTIVINLEQFSVLTDLFGGLGVFIPEPVDISGEDGSRYLLPSGMVTLDGDKVKTYLAYPDTEGIPSDLEERRQTVMLSFFQALARNASYMSDKKVFRQLAEHLSANIEKDDLQKLFMYIAEVDAERLVPQTVTGTQRELDGATLLFPFYDGTLIKDVVKQSMNGLLSEEGSGQSRIYVLEIQNGTTTPGLARNTSVLYQGFGYDVLNSVNADKSDYTETIVVDHIGNETAVKQVAEIIHCKNIITEEIRPDAPYDQSVSLVDFTIILGRDFDGRYVR